MCAMCGCGMGGNNGDIQSPNSPMITMDPTMVPDSENPLGA
jgi:hypothetical protein